MQENKVKYDVSMTLTLNPTHMINPKGMAGSMKQILV